MIGGSLRFSDDTAKDKLVEQMMMMKDTENSVLKTGVHSRDVSTKCTIQIALLQLLT